MALKFIFKRECLTNVEDAAGRTQIEGGKLMEGSTKQVGTYSSVKRISCGTQAMNTAQLWITLFFTGEKPPQNITLHGAHDFGSGNQIGSVSAASLAHKAQIGRPFKRTGDTLQID